MLQGSYTFGGTLHTTIHVLCTTHRSINRCRQSRTQQYAVNRTVNVIATGPGASAKCDRSLPPTTSGLRRRQPTKQAPKDMNDRGHLFRSRRQPLETRRLYSPRHTVGPRCQGDGSVSIYHSARGFWRRSSTCRDLVRACRCLLVHTQETIAPKCK